MLFREMGHYPIHGPTGKQTKTAVFLFYKTWSITFNAVLLCEGKKAGSWKKDILLKDILLYKTIDWRYFTSVSKKLHLIQFFQ